ncbi:uncharacterized protein CcaverHIS019_0603320 [Cutaneotrichosporon cavernicola]|uniref:C3H1-type domain-containing protein n=1 Tax=Cutaneotrichosporon cavernicola TaxID=279322 RepID=A0AA48QY05_9TREE|nr:uncharacterized protein CcaverHIS019_0603320 [Cutaneotrichosporon cavernicola]BEI93873.1 hypothetical protein CcaverHIS019_0603320 [Cutaneotrichosporon cavernicola]BEJ01651.1 hypothetical protein CcaverHIS631_0603330 [Cutaneotrichosporon cavernicola]BEJ09419.1 hypothetical protein CcaverHIS641_0603340 [Cutaneotrichosporon cavernicola]
MDAVRASARTQSPAPSPHGAIGEALGHHARSSSMAAGRPATPRTNPQTSSSSAEGDELDLNALMVHGQRQRELSELDRSRFGRFGIAPPSASAGPTVPLRGRTGFGVGGGLGDRSDSPSRWPNNDEWREAGSRSRDASMHRQSSGAGAVNSVTPTGPSLSFMDQPFPSPIGRPRGSMGNIGFGNPATPNAPAEPAQAAQHHLTALSNIIEPLCRQNDELIRLRAEVELWRGEWQRRDRECRRLESIVKSEDPAKGRPKFSVALIDGDGLIFQDEHLGKGYTGGQAAARALIGALPGLTGRVSRDADIMPIENTDTKPRDLGQVVVQVFLNKGGLGHALVKSGSVPSWSVYDAFWQGFASAHDLFSVVDVGHGKEATDTKIREHLKLYAAHAQCGTVILGASHDNSYGPVLASLDTTMGLSKVVILQGYSDLALQLQPYASRCVSIPELFRTRRIGPAPGSATMQAQGKKGRRGSRAQHESDMPIASPPPPPPSAQPAPPAIGSAPTTPPPAEGEIEIEVVEWEALVNGAANMRLEEPRGRRQRNGSTSLADDDEKKKGLGAKKGKPATRATTVPTVRNLKPRPCHTFYLSPWGCKNGDGCEYAHHYKLNEDQTEELARLAKEIICPYVRSKRCHFKEDECVYGHRCPRGERCTFGETCRFKDLPNGHGEETAAAAAAAAAAADEDSPSSA